jgi:uncharacterized membrane protein YbhN (UPF0104 family)
MAYWVDFRAVGKELAAVDWRLAGLATLAHYATYPVRGYRWKQCLGSKAAAAGTRKFGLIVFFYNFVDNLVPAKLGDLYAAHMVRINLDIGRSPALGALVFLRMVDAWLVLALAAFASWILFSSQFPASVAWGLAGGIVLAVIVSGVLLAFMFLNHALPDWVPERGRKMVEGFHEAMLPQRHDVPPVAASTVLIWLLEILWIYLLLRAFGIEPGFVETVFITMLPLLASGFPLTPAGAGAVELTLFGCLHMLGVPGPLAASITLLNRFFDYWLHILLGVATWGIRRRLGLRTWREVPLEAFPLVKTSSLTI